MVFYNSFHFLILFSYILSLHSSTKILIINEIKRLNGDPQLRLITNTVANAYMN